MASDLVFSMYQPVDNQKVYHDIERLDNGEFVVHADPRYPLIFEVQSEEAGSMAMKVQGDLAQYGVVISSRPFYCLGYEDDYIYAGLSTGSPIDLVLYRYPLVSFIAEDDIEQGEYTVQRDGYDQYPDKFVHKNNIETELFTLAMNDDTENRIALESDGKSYILDFAVLDYGVDDFFNVSEG